MALENNIHKSDGWKVVVMDFNSHESEIIIYMEGYVILLDICPWDGRDVLTQIYPSISIEILHIETRTR